ncbi:unnamed protein product [Parascedosporium putredinis]|uniref:Uncharacterized protein n=1 Tax=Parascedosporium putredinis TaxID=1442378 RepID=A0A9P1HCM2_9PEZI|nr:unnamed protein product [Parascedosporium putredinis]CAI8004589.1 unnamed protein product [Parascedosporium putredinis]
MAHEPFSEGKHALPYQRPEPRCRTFNSTVVEEVIEQMRKEIVDPDLFRLFENTFPNTLDTTISWKGFGSEDPNEERQPAPELQTPPQTGPVPGLPRLPLPRRHQPPGPLHPPVPALQRLPAPDESSLANEYNGGVTSDFVVPRFSRDIVFECKYELDSLAAFLQLSHDYHSRTDDLAFFRDSRWRDTIGVIMDAASALLAGTYASDGSINKSPYMFERKSNKASETMSNDGAGAPSRATPV